MTIVLSHRACQKCVSTWNFVPLSDLIALAEAGFQAEEDEDDTSRLSELIALAEAGLQVEEPEDDTGRLSELIILAEAGL